MDRPDGAGRGRRPPFYMCYRRERGRMVIPRATYYDRAARQRMRNEAQPDPIVLQNDNLDGAAVNLEVANRPDDLMVEENVNNAVQEGIHEDDEILVDQDANAMNAPFFDELVGAGQNIPVHHDVANLTAGDKNIEVDEDLEMQLTPDIQRTKFETLLMVLNFSIRHGLTFVAIQDLLSMINVITGSDLPETRYMFKKIFPSDMELKFHMYCPDCMVYIGEITPELKVRKTAQCRNENCRKQVKVPGMNSKEFFVTLPVGKQIAEMLQNMGDDVLEQLNYRWEREPSDNIRDIYDGEIYKNLMKDGKFLSDRYNLSLTFSTDGASVFNSGCTTMWPIFFRLNELKPSIRFDESNCMLAGLWFGQKEPPMAMYLNKFLSECRDLYERGIMWRSPDGQVINSKIITLNCVLDSGAKYMLQATKKFNGMQSCPYCDHPGVTYFDNQMAKWPMNEQRVTFSDLGYSYEIRKYNRRVQDYETHDVFDRSNEDMRRDMEIAEARRRREPSFEGYKGLKSMSPMCVLPFFDVCLGFQIDYMHNTLLGNCQHLASLWIDSSSHQKDYYVGLRAAEIDERLLAMTPPSSFSRLTRSISQWKDWHANEWRSWLLYYSLPCFKGNLPALNYKHHCVLVSALHILLRDNISKGDLDSVAEYLADYVTEFEVLYGVEEMFFNVHLLLHLSKSVLHWGPLWCYSMFSFESANNTVIKLVKGATGVASQIVSKYSMSKFLPHLLKVYTISNRVQKYCNDLMCYSRYASAIKSAGIVLQAPSEEPLTNEEGRAFRFNNMRPTLEFYNIMIKDNIKYFCRLYKRSGKRCDDSIARLSDGTYAAIIRIMRQADGEVIVLMREVNTERGFISHHHATGAKAKHIKLCRQELYGDLFFCNAREIVAKSILMKCPPKCYITDFPNIIEKD